MHKQFVIASIFIFCLGFQLQAQQKSSLADSTKLQVSSLHGLELKIEDPEFAGYGAYGIGYPFFVDYVHEQRLTPSTTILYKAGLSITMGAFYEDSTYMHLFDPNEKTGHKVGFCSFGADFVVEPRWYWNFQKRAQAGKARLNSGWFLSLPVEISIPRIACIYGPAFYYDTSSKWLKNYFYLFYSLGISTGYRYALLKNLFLEASLEIQVTGDWEKYTESYSFSPTTIMPQLEIKASYVFNQKK